MPANQNPARLHRKPINLNQLPKHVAVLHIVKGRHRRQAMNVARCQSGPKRVLLLVNVVASAFREKLQGPCRFYIQDIASGLGILFHHRLQDLTNVDESCQQALLSKCPKPNPRYTSMDAWKPASWTLSCSASN